LFHVNPPSLRSATTRPTAAALIAHLGLQKVEHEGLWFIETYLGTDRIEGEMAARYPGPRRSYSAIYGLTTRLDFSAMHRLATDELWHFYAGDPLELLLLHPGGRGEIVIVGPEVFAGQRPQVRVPRGVWQGARPIGGDDAWTLGGYTMAPGFDYADYEPGHRAELQAGWPEFAEMIRSLTREAH